MSDILVQTLLAARKGDFEDWANILFVLVLAVFWVLGGIIKARGAVRRGRKEEEQLPGKPERRPPERARGLRRQTFGPVQRREYRPVAQQLRARISRPQPIVPKYAPKTEEGVRVRPLEVPEVPGVSKLPPSMPSVRLERKEAREPVDKPFVERLLDFDDADKLKRAILHYEIFGKPVSLRSSEEQR
jgi:hypothetical protein